MITLRTKWVVELLAGTVTISTSLLVSAALCLPAGQQKKAVKSTSSAAVAKPDLKLIALGKATYDAQGCGGCHAISGKGGNSGPDLTETGAVVEHTVTWFEAQVSNPKTHNPASTMPSFPRITGQNQIALASYLGSLKAPATAGATAAPVHRSGAKPDATVVAKIEKSGGSIGPLAQSDDRLAISFHMAGPTVTDKDVAPLSGIKDVVTLDLGQTGITDAGLARIVGLKDLTELHLENTRITDAGLVALKNMSRLVYLNLYGTGITDVGLAHLTHLISLRHLYVWQTKVTQAGVDSLKKSLPQVEIVQGWDAAPKK